MGEEWYEQKQGQVVVRMGDSKTMQGRDDGALEVGDNREHCSVMRKKIKKDCMRQNHINNVSLYKASWILSERRKKKNKIFRRCKKKSRGVSKEHMYIPI